VSAQQVALKKKRPAPTDGPAKSCGRFHHPPYCQCHLAHLGVKTSVAKAAPGSPRAIPKKVQPFAAPQIVPKKKPMGPPKKGACGRNGHRPDCRCHLKHRQNLPTSDDMPKKKAKITSPKLESAPETKNPFRPAYSSGRVSWTSTSAALSSSYTSQPANEPEELGAADLNPAGGNPVDFTKNATSCGRFHHPVGCQCHVKHKMVNASMLSHNKRSPIASASGATPVKEEPY